MKRKILKSVKGSVCIFLSLCMLPMMTVGGMLTDAAKIQSAKTEISGAAELSANAALSYYDRTLQDMYGLFAISEDMDSLEQNVAKYYRETLEGYGFLEIGDSFTREFINSLFGALDDGNAEIDSILDIYSDTFSIEGVSNSSLANPNVLENQIVEYMKYRAPIELGKGIISKISSISELSLQSKAAEKKLQCEKEFSKSEDYAQDAYDAICEFNRCLKQTGMGVNSGTDTATAFNRSMESAVDYYKIMTAYITVLNGYPDICTDSIELTEDREQEYSEVCDQMNATEKIQYLLESAERLLKTDKCASAISTVESGEYISVGVSGDNIKKAEAAVVSLNGMIKCVSDGYSGIAQAAAYANEASKILKREKITLAETEKKRIEEIAAYPDKCSEFIDNVKEKASEDGISWGRTASEALYNFWYVPVADCIDALENAVEAIDALISNTESLQASRSEWKESIDSLSDGSIKSSMYVDYDCTVAAFDEESAAELKAAVEKELKLLKNIESGMEAVTFFEKKIATDKSTVNKYSKTYAQLSKKIEAFSPEPEMCIASAQQIVDGNFHTYYVDSGTFSGLGIIDGSDKETEFFAELEKNCGKNTGDTASGSENTSDLKDSLISYATQNSESAELSEDVPDSIKDRVGESVLNRIEELSGYADLKSETFSPELSSGADDSETVSEASSMLSKISDMMDGLKNIAEYARDDLYVEEYISGMFSCYTDTAKAKTETVLSLSGADLSENEFFGAEIEYIIWGNDSPNVNVAETQAIIFGIRFALNSIYALTASETRRAALTAATAIAGWTGFGVPIVENVILVSWALAESAVDLQLLCQGKSVALYKSKTTWYLGLGGVKKLAVEAAAAIASAAVDDIFTKIDNFLIDGSEECIDELEETVDEYIESGIDTVYEQVQSAITVPIERLALSLSSSGQNIGIPEMTEKLKEVFNTVKSSGNGLVGQCIDLAVDKLLSEELQNISSELVKLCECTNSAENTEAQINVILYGEDGNSGLLGKLKDKVTGYIEDTVEDYADECKDDIAEKIQNSTGNIKSSIKDRLSTYVENISGDSSGNQTAGGDPTSASLLSMSYKDYLKILIFMKYAANKETVLKRTAQLIQINVSAESQSSDFDITNSPTVISCFASGKISTVFMGTYFGGKNTGSSSTGSSKVKSITYSAVYGY